MFLQEHSSAAYRPEASILRADPGHALADCISDEMFPQEHPSQIGVQATPRHEFAAQETRPEHRLWRLAVCA
jgi:hypothetical protein